ncbi:hypothetical protein N658DRAFT_499715, partial [Parathielavia hyrcaniae]
MAATGLSVQYNPTSYVCRSLSFTLLECDNQSTTTPSASCKWTWKHPGWGETDGPGRLSH